MNQLMRIMVDCPNVNFWKFPIFGQFRSFPDSSCLTLVYFANEEGNSSRTVRLVANNLRGCRKQNIGHWCDFFSDEGKPYVC